VGAYQNLQNGLEDISCLVDEELGVGHPTPATRFITIMNPEYMKLQAFNLEKSLALKSLKISDLVKCVQVVFI
jgi:hypothetical protein